MPSIGQENLETVMIDFLGALRRGDFEAAAGCSIPTSAGRGRAKSGPRRTSRCHARAFFRLIYAGREGTAHLLG